MEVGKTARGYDALAPFWADRHRDSGYGVKQLERAIGFSLKKGKALDVGCGSSGRFMRVLLAAGYEVEGMDCSAEMLKLAKLELPECGYFQGDIASCDLSDSYAFISAWDSTFHLPLAGQEPALKTMCEALRQGGILIYTFGGVSDAGEISGGFEGQDFEYSSLGLSRNLELIAEFGCECLHLEFDQGPGEGHVYLIARKK
ncbi:class I SAM-dependent methyltransferase [Rubritalea spongiae]|uniref:Class I SAM-dependent methyltransferase n=1 Tax=Rubritalea spongiae TaxID=430797 RepID=A0ABW5E3G0_9BACT